MRNLLWLLVIAACGSSPAPRRPLGVAEHYAVARVHDEQAQEEQDRAVAAEQRASAAIACGDRTLAEQSTSGGKPISLMVPCWTARDASTAHMRRAAQLRREARAHRAIARNLLEAERVACERIPDSQRDHSPSFHKDDIVAVEAIRDGGPVIGARVVFRKVEGLTAEFLRAAYACNQAEAAVEGFDPTFLGYCPATLPGVTVEVTDQADGFAVTFRADKRDTAAVVWGRASDLSPAARTSASVP